MAAWQIAALPSDQKARITLDDLKALFEELREEEAEHVNMIVKIIARPRVPRLRSRMLLI